MKNTPSFQALLPRKHTSAVMVGNIGIGGENPIRVQTMTNTDTLDITKTVKQIIACANAGAELVRVTTPSVKHAQAVLTIKEKLLKKGFQTPIIADVHFLPQVAYEAIKYADKVRLNPGNVFEGTLKTYSSHNKKTDTEIQKRLEEEIFPFVSALKKEKTPIRIGTNYGSLSERILYRYGDTPLGMVEATMEYLRIFQKHDFHEIVVALKASNPLIMIEANRMLVFHMEQEKMDYPLHLGVTEAGNESEGRAKSCVGIGTLLLEGIGDTIRVSLTEDPVKEIPEAYNILQATQRRITKTEFISCPSCGRTLFDIEKVSKNIKKHLGHFAGIRIAIMGCIVNGLGEMADADFGYVGGAPGKIHLYRKKKLVKKNVPEEKAMEELIQLIKDENV